MTPDKLLNREQEIANRRKVARIMAGVTQTLEEEDQQYIAHLERDLELARKALWESWDWQVRGVQDLAFYDKEVEKARIYLGKERLTI